MSDVGKSLAAFVVPLAVGRLIEFTLGTRLGKDLAEATGNPSLATPEGRHIIRKYSGAAAAIALGAALTLGRRPDARRGAPRDRVETLGLLSEALLSAGALIKVAVDYMRDKREMEQRRARSA